jgi:hypothetical protein
MSRESMRAVALGMQTAAINLPRARAPMASAAVRDGQFVRVSRELTWGLTLNK